MPIYAFLRNSFIGVGCVHFVVVVAVNLTLLFFIIPLLAHYCNLLFSLCGSTSFLIKIKSLRCLGCSCLNIAITKEKKPKSPNPSKISFLFRQPAIGRIHGSRSIHSCACSGKIICLKIFFKKKYYI